MYKRQQLYSKEFLELVKSRLNENGLFVKWIPIYTMSVEDFRNLYKTFDSVFPNTIAFVNIKESENLQIINRNENFPEKFEATQIIFIGSQNQINLDNKTFNTNYNLLSKQAKENLNAIQLSSGEKILNLLLFDSLEIKDYAKDAELVTDDKPILEFSTAKKVINPNPKEVIQDINQFLKQNE